MGARADMESASARRQSLRAAGKLPEGLSASGAVGVTRGAMVGDQSLRKAREGWRDRVINAGFVSSCERAGGQLEAQALGLLPGQPAVGFWLVIGRVISQALSAPTLQDLVHPENTHA